MRILEENITGIRLKKLRNKMDLRQEKVAADLSITVYQLSRYENGKSKPTPELMAQFAIYYKVTGDYLLGLSDDPRLTEDGQKQVYDEFNEIKRMMENLSEEDKKRVKQRLLDFMMGAIDSNK